MDSSVSKLNNLLSEMSGRRAAATEAEVLYAPILSPHFNCFNFIRPNENKISTILADLLDPKGSHGQGGLFLSLLSECFNFGFTLDQNHWMVKTEVSTSTLENKMKRIDIEINCGNFGIGIENKPWAADQNNQLNDYSLHLSNRYGDKWYLIYLSGSGTDPHDRSISAGKRKELEDQGKLKMTTYKELVNWLIRCEEKCHSEHVRHFLKDFIDYTHKTFCGGINMIDGNWIVDTILKNPDNLKSAFQLFPTEWDIKKKLLEKLKSDLAELVTSGWELEWKVDPYSKNTDFGFKKTGWTMYRIGCEFGGTNLNELRLGVFKTKAEYSDLNLDIEEINNKMGVHGDKDTWWAWFSLSGFGPIFNNWASNVEPWLEIQSQSKDMAKRILNELENLFLIVGPSIDKVEAIK